MDDVNYDEEAELRRLEGGGATARGSGGSGGGGSTAVHKSGAEPRRPTSRQHMESAAGYFCLGAPSMLTRNVNPLLGLANGSQAVYHSLGPWAKKTKKTGKIVVINKGWHAHFLNVRDAAARAAERSGAERPGAALPPRQRRRVLPPPRQRRPGSPLPRPVARAASRL